MNLKSVFKQTYMFTQLEDKIEQVIFHRDFDLVFQEIEQAILKKMSFQFAIDDYLGNKILNNLIQEEINREVIEKIKKVADQEVLDELMKLSYK